MSEAFATYPYMSFLESSFRHRLAAHENLKSSLINDSNFTNIKTNLKKYIRDLSSDLISKLLRKFNLVFKKQQASHFN